MSTSSELNKGWVFKLVCPSGHEVLLPAPSLNESIQPQFICPTCAKPKTDQLDKHPARPGFIAQWWATWKFRRQLARGKEWKDWV